MILQQNANLCESRLSGAIIISDMDIGLYYDPSSAHSWVTSRWLVEAMKQREIYIRWHAFSLSLLYGGGVAEQPHDQASHDRYEAHRVLRVIEAAGLGGANRGDVYTAFGYEYFVKNRAYSDEVIDDVLKELHLERLRDAADSSALDADLNASIREAASLLGDRLNVPMIVFEVGQKRIGYFGPILNAVPNTEASVRLWDSIATLSTTAEFYELVRPLPKPADNTPIAGHSQQS